MKKVVGLTLSLLLIFVCALAIADVPIDQNNFPDEVFRKYVQKQFDSDHNNVLSDSEIAAVTRIDIDIPAGDNSDKISNLQGIGSFYNLTYLTCLRNNLSELDLSGNKKLTDLWCSYNPLGELDVSKNTDLKVLSCYDNGLTKLDISKNTKLIKLYCGANPITALDVSKNPALEILKSIDGKLKSLDVSKNLKLVQLWCANNSLTSLTLGNNKSLTQLWCNGNKLNELNISKQTELKKLYKGKGKEYSGYGYGWWTENKDKELEKFLFVDKTVTIKIKAEGDINVTEITLDSTVSLTRTTKAKKPTLLLKAEVLPEDATEKTLEWSSSDPKVVKVDQTGKITGLKPGKAVITCKAMDDSGVSAKCEVTVENQLIEKLTLKYKNKSVKKEQIIEQKSGSSFQLTVIIKPSTAFSKKVKWESTDTTVATVSKSGKVKVVGKAGESCWIYCTAADGSGIRAKCRILVK